MLKVYVPFLELIFWVVLLTLDDCPCQIHRTKVVSFSWTFSSPWIIPSSLPRSAWILPWTLAWMPNCWNECWIRMLGAPTLPLYVAACRLILPVEILAFLCKPRIYVSSLGACWFFFSLARQLVSLVRLAAMHAYNFLHWFVALSTDVVTDRLGWGVLDSVQDPDLPLQYQQPRRDLPWHFEGPVEPGPDNLQSLAVYLLTPDRPKSA